jgi:hypothetical protein
MREIEGLERGGTRQEGTRDRRDEQPVRRRSPPSAHLGVLPPRPRQRGELQGSSSHRRLRERSSGLRGGCEATDAIRGRQGRPRSSRQPRVDRFSAPARLSSVYKLIACFCTKVHAIRALCSRSTGRSCVHGHHSWAYRTRRRS